jgi:hypothetical protein
LIAPIRVRPHTQLFFSFLGLLLWRMRCCHLFWLLTACY